MASDPAGEATLRWFGESWGARVCHVLPHDATPVGCRCVACPDRIQPADQGFMVPRKLFPMPEFGPGSWAAVFDCYHRQCFAPEAT